MQSNVKATVKRCFERGMDVANTVAFIMVNHCAAELPRPYLTARKRLTAEVTIFFEELRNEVRP
jgi:hypothetical protein